MKDETPFLFQNNKLVNTGQEEADQRIKINTGHFREIKTIYVFAVICCFIFITNTRAQQVEFNTKINLPKKHYSISQLFELLITGYNVNLSYDSDLDAIKTNLSFPKNEYTLNLVLEEIEAQCETIQFVVQDNNIVARKIKKAVKYTISGFIKSKADGEALIGAHVMDITTGGKTISDMNGYFSLTLGKGINKLQISYAGYDTLYNLNTTHDTTMLFNFDPTIQIDEIKVSATRSHSVTGSNNEFLELSAETLKQLPKLMGEGDVIKALQLMPGVHQTSEGGNNISVRGGSGDQNQVLIDGVEVYNPNHLLGFFSVFNEDAINAVHFYKGNIPARYNAKAASVTDIRLKEGNNKRFGVKGSIGLLSSKLLVEGPVLKDKCSFLVTGRISHVNLYAEPLVDTYTDFEEANYFFYDVTAKLNYTINNRNHLYVSFYNGLDNGNSETRLVYGNESELLPDTDNTLEQYQSQWGNTIYLLRWNKQVGANSYLNMSGHYSHFYYESNKKIVLNGTYNDTLEINDLSYNFKSSSQIEDIGINPELTFPIGNRIKPIAGFKLNYIYTNPINESFIDSSNVSTDNTSSTSNSDELTVATLYIDNKINLTNSLVLNLGINIMSVFVNEKVYTGFYPRINGIYHITKKAEVHASYSAMGQYLSQLSHYRVSLASDLWVPVSEDIQPVLSHLSALGGSYDLHNGFKTSIDAYYTRMFNLLSYSEGQTFNNQEQDWQEQLTTGKGYSYGVELTLERTTGKITGWASYTWSRSFRQYNEINSGEEFPYKYDRPHDFKIALFYKLNKRIEISPVWVLNSGALETVGVSRSASAFELSQSSEEYYNGYGYDNGTDIMDYEYNAYRLPLYHRLDISINIHFTIYHKWKSVLSLGAYNVYNRENSYSLSMVPVGGETDRYYYRFEEQSLFGIIPFINYSFNF